MLLGQARAEHAATTEVDGTSFLESCFSIIFWNENFSPKQVLVLTMLHIESLEVLENRIKVLYFGLGILLPFPLPTGLGFRHRSFLSVVILWDPRPQMYVS